MAFCIRLFSSMEKIFCDEEPSGASVSGGSALRGERHNFQFAVNSDCGEWVELDIADAGLPVTVREVGLVPGNVPEPGMRDDNYLRTQPGLFPDPLLPEESRNFRISARSWKSFWVTVEVPETQAPGEYPVAITLRRREWHNGEKQPPEEHRVCYQLEVKNSVLPEPELLHTQWFHTDCLFSFYRVKPWSPEAWTLLERYFRAAHRLGINLLLTPIWTPPLDTAVGTDRPTTQLIGIVRENGHYRFDFTHLEHWFALAQKCGIKSFEMAHAFTQWGAQFTPQIVAMEDGVEKKIFGWHVASDAAEYANFLHAFLPELCRVIRENKLEKNVFFHVSDEPEKKHLEIYRKAYKLLKSQIGDFPVIDALSNVDFFANATPDIPIPSVDHLEDFIRAGVPRRFTYYCVGQWKDVPNRFMAMPSARNRIMGVMMYLYDIKGFLQWGFNFWYSQFSLKHRIDPWLVTDAYNAFPSGDAFLVYPGADGEPVDSIRGEVFYEAQQDLRALRLLEKHIGRANVEELINRNLDSPLSMTQYPKDAAWLLELRKKVNDILA
ncbi:MAG: DUF4091 domain-containing protein [Victivallaceae bacterium]|nr:DUF4091 domain-containing protein [Victivallaceae bacterium]